MLKRIITGLIIIACVIPPLLFGGILSYLLVGAIVLVGGFELFELLPSYKGTPKIIFFLLLAICFSMFFISAKYNFIILGLMVISMMALPIFYERVNSRDAIMISAFLILLYCFGKAFFMIYDENPLYVWFIIVATYGCDTGAYFTGYFFGKHKLCERISPKKTIEGSIGGIVFSWILSFLFVFFLFKEANILLVLIGGLLMPIVSQIGDLSFSAIKRFYKIKDFSNIFPGHGGFMDRLDSLIYDLIVFYALMVVIL